MWGASARQGLKSCPHNPQKTGIQGDASPMRRWRRISEFGEAEFLGASFHDALRRREAEPRGLSLPDPNRRAESRMKGGEEMFNKRRERLIHIQESERNFREQLEREPLEKKDVPAMILAALIVFVPALLFVIGLFLLLSWLFFR